MHPDRIAELLRPFLRPVSGSPHAVELLPVQLKCISTYIDLLLRWNARMNLTSVRRPEEIVPRHFGESFFAARHLLPYGQTIPAEEQAASRIHVIDVGSGAGFPGLPIKIWAPYIHLTLIESNHKKATFLREVARSLTLTDVDVFTGRAESLLAPRANEPMSAPGNRRGNIVTLRAVERFDAVLPTAANLLDSSGRLALLVGRPQIDQARTVLPNLEWSDPVALPLSSSRAMIIGR
jgi:16S rRNA (guanine527-N7)-methyltransferase